MKTLTIDDQVNHKTFGRGTVRSVEGHEDYAKLLEHLKNYNPTPLQDRQFKGLNEKERWV